MRMLLHVSTLSHLDGPTLVESIPCKRMNAYIKYMIDFLLKIDRMCNQSERKGEYFLAFLNIKYETSH